MSAPVDRFTLSDYPFNMAPPAGSPASKYSFLVTTSSPEAQDWFNKGMVWTYSFGHEEARWCFERAIKCDPHLAMAYWGVSYSHGPNYKPRRVMTMQSRPTSLRAQATALLHWRKPFGDRFDLPETTASDISHSRAVTHRYVWPRDSVEPRQRIEVDYCLAMQQVHAEFKSNVDVASLYAESIMNLRPWQLWKDGQPACGSDGEPHTQELLDLLEAAIETHPHHPGVLHFYIHAWEMSPTPERALPAANRLRELVPDAGHMLHMPSHIDVLVGHYGDAIAANRLAVAADDKFKAFYGNDNFYTLYRLHDLHLLIYAAMFEGQYEPAMWAARKMQDEIPAELLQGEMFDWLEGFVSTFYHVFIRFGRWDDILAEPAPPEDGKYPYTRTIRHYARGVARAAKGQVEEAKQEQEQFLAALSAVPSTEMIFNNACTEIAKVATEMLEGEILFRLEGRRDDAYQHLRRAVELDTTGLVYDEPWGWMQPARHALGALLLEGGHLGEAEEVYRADLKDHPNNVWALHGLAECMEARLGGDSGNNEELKEVRSKLTAAIARADVPVVASCACRTSRFK